MVINWEATARCFEIWWVDGNGSSVLVNKDRSSQYKPAPGHTWRIQRSTSSFSGVIFVQIVRPRMRIASCDLTVTLISVTAELRFIDCGPCLGRPLLSVGPRSPGSTRREHILLQTTHWNSTEFETKTNLEPLSSTLSIRIHILLSSVTLAMWLFHKLCYTG